MHSAVEAWRSARFDPCSPMIAPVRKYVAAEWGSARSPRAWEYEEARDGKQTCLRTATGFQSGRQIQPLPDRIFLQGFADGQYTLREDARRRKARQSAAGSRRGPR